MSFAAGDRASVPAHHAGEHQIDESQATADDHAALAMARDREASAEEGADQVSSQTPG